MRWYYIVGGLLLLPCLLLLLRVGVEYRFGGSEVMIRIGPVRKKLTPGEEKEPKQPKKKKVETAEAAPKTEKSPKPNIGFNEVQSGVKVLLPVLKKALRRTRRSVKIHPLNLHVIIAAYDPAETAKLYGWGEALLWSVMPQAERLLVIPDPHIRLTPDFNADSTRCEGEIGVSIRIGSVLLIALTLLIPALRWYKALPKATAETAPAANAEEGNNAASTDAAVIPEDKSGENTTRGE